MPRTKTQRCRRLLVLFCMFVIFSASFTVSAFADYVNVTTGTSYSYFQTYSSKGVWTGVGTPTHTIVQTGAPVYCLQTDYSSPSGSGYTDTDPWNYYDATTICGLQAILEHGYPNDSGGYTADEARYATANAIRFWLAERGAQGVPTWMNLSKYSHLFRAAYGYEGLFDWCMYLLDCARNQVLIEHEISFSEPEFAVAGDYYEYTTTVSLTNCGLGYTLDRSGLPDDAVIEGHTGNSGDVLTIRIPTKYDSSIYTLSATGVDNRTAASLIYYAPDNWNEQRIVTYSYDIESNVATASVQISTPEKPKTGKLIIHKYDAETTGPISGVSFGLFDMSGTQIAEAVTDDTGTVIITDIPAGEYFFREISAPGMYVADDTQHNFIVSTDEELSFDIYNTRKVGSITVLKQDAYGNALPGAVFLLERSTDGGTTWDWIAEQSSDNGGAAVFSELSISGVYRVTEIKAPAGHTLQSGVLFEGELGDSGSYDISFISCDCTIMTLPFTGQSGFRYIQFAALMLCMSLFIISKTKKEKPE